MVYRKVPMLSVERIIEALNSEILIVRDGREITGEIGMTSYFVEIPGTVAGEKYLVYARREHRGWVRILRRISSRGIYRGIMSLFHPFISYISTRRGCEHDKELVHSFSAIDSERLFYKLQSLALR